jgi:hypothetical protein
VPYIHATCGPEAIRAELDAQNRAYYDSYGILGKSNAQIRAEVEQAIREERAELRRLEGAVFPLCAGQRRPRLSAEAWERVNSHPAALMPPWPPGAPADAEIGFLRELRGGLVVLLSVLVAAGAVYLFLGWRW